jgi:Orsellinic acid/F9775 biosynthesis cluster protein D
MRHQKKCPVGTDVLEVTVVEKESTCPKLQVLLMVVVEFEEEECLESQSSRMDITDEEISVQMLVTVDELYNLVVCNECGIGIPFEWVKSHLIDHHGIRKSENEVWRELNVERKPMTVEEAKDWIKDIWVGRAVQGIPVTEGWSCTECEYSAAMMQVMRNHFVKDHKGFTVAEHVERCKVQLVFKGVLHKYIQIEEPKDVDVDVQREPEWVMAVNREFGKSMANVKVAGGKGKTNLQLMNVFIAKTRWDSLVKDDDLEEIVKMASMPTINRRLHKVILCSRRYIRMACKELDKGSIIIKRLLMSGG